MKRMTATLKNKINLARVPQHLAIIMDGNGRWAKKKGMLRTFGHQNAIKAVRSAIEGCNELNIPYLTLYAFSSENWKRPTEEVNFLMNLLFKTLTKELHTFQENNIRLRTIGSTQLLPTQAQAELNKVIDATKNNTKATLTLALSYGSQDEIIDAVKKICKEVVGNQKSIESISPEDFRNYLYTTELPDVDLMIRTSGELRISNFLLWQSAYAELHFTKVLWPDFRKKDLFKAVIDYQSRERRFGKTSEQLV